MPLPHPSQKHLSACLLFLLLIACKPSPIANFQESEVLPITVSILPLSYQNEIPTDSICKWVEEFPGIECQVLPPMQMPKSAENTTRGIRYSADSILHFLQSFQHNVHEMVLGITSTEIYSSKREMAPTTYPNTRRYRAWALFGYGYMPGSTCIVSTKRLRNANTNKFHRRVRLVLLHELGHNIGLAHCSNSRCVMNGSVETIKTLDQSSGELCSKYQQKTALKFQTIP